MDTPFVEWEKYHKHEKQEVRQQLNARQPIRRLGKREEIAHMALHLCADEAEFVNGAMMSIDGNWTAV